MARVIAEAAVRLVVDKKGLGASIRREFRAAVKEATAGGNLFDDVNRDADDSAKRVRLTWAKALGGVRSLLGGFASSIGTISKALLAGVAVAGAVAGVVSLTSAVLALGSALVQASGVAALLPAALAAIVAVNATLKIGLSGISDGFKAIGEDAATFNEAIKNLAPNAQDFLRSVRSMKPAFDQLRLDVQNRLFLDLGDTVKKLGTTYLPVADRLFVTIAGSLNNAARQTAAFALSGKTVGTVGTLVDNVRTAVESLSRAFAPAIAALLDITTVGSSFLPGFADSIREASVRFAEFIRAAAESGRLQQFFQNAIDTVQQLGRIAGNVFGGIGNIMDAARVTGGGLLSTLENITASFKEFTGSAQGQEALQTFFASMQRAVRALGPAFFELITVIGRDFVPILADLASIIGPVLRPLFEAFGQLLQAARPLIDALAKAFAKALGALQPFFEALGKAIEEALPVLIPIIDDIGKAFADLFEAMVPLAPVFVDLLEAVLPILPPFLDMVVEIMPELIDIIKAAMPIIQGLVDLFVAILPIITDVVNFILNVFVPIFTVIGETIGGLYDVIAFVINKIWEVITTVFGAIGDFFVGFWNDTTAVFHQFLGPIADFFSGGFNGMFQNVVNWASGVLTSIRNTMSGMVSNIGQGISDAVQWFKDLPGRVLGALGDVGSWLFNAGKQVIQGLLNGLKAAVGSILNFFKNLVSQAVSSVTDALKMGSPSKVFYDIGINTGQGWINGLKAISPAVAAAAADMAGVTLDGFGNPLLGSASGGTGAGAAGAATVVNQTNVMQPGTDVKQFSDLVLGRSWGDYLSGAATLTVARNGVQAGVNDQWVGA
jgi:phage-related protein